MKHKATLVSLATIGGLTAVLALLFGLTGLATPIRAATSIRYVAPGAYCGGQSLCYGSVQAAVDDADEDDVIKVAAGNYTDIHVRGGITQVVYINKTVTIRGGYTLTNWITPDLDANITTLDAQNLGRVMVISGTITPTIKGLHITRGNATGLGGGSVSFPSYDVGGGVHIAWAAATISNCVISGNTANSVGPGLGGGVFLYASRAVLGGNTVQGNIASTAEHGEGGGLFLHASPATLSGNTVQGNIASTAGRGIGGGLGLYVSDAVLIGNTIVGNTAASNPVANGYGGGLSAGQGADFFALNNVIAGNHANTHGSGVYVWNMSGGYPLSSRLLHTTIADNHGSGDGMHVSGAHVTLAFTNTIVTGHTVGIAGTSGVVTLNGTLWHDNGMDTGGDIVVISSANMSGAPAFLNPAALDYHLGPSSAAIDTGIEAGVYTDIDGDQRPLDGDANGVAVMDLGADEAHWQWQVNLPLVLKLCNSTGIPLQDRGPPSYGRWGGRLPRRTLELCERNSLQRQ